MDKKDHAINYLVSTYPGEEAWQKLAAECGAELDERSDKDYFTSYFDDHELAAVLARHFDRHAIDWFNSTEIPALYGFSPRDLWYGQGESRNALRSMLMRMPGRP
jgi:hypothetical protein